MPQLDLLEKRLITEEGRMVSIDEASGLAIKLSEYNILLTLGLASKNNADIAEAYAGIAGIYRALGREKDTLEFYNKALVSYKEAGNAEDFGGKIASIRQNIEQMEESDDRGYLTITFFVTGIKYDNDLLNYQAGIELLNIAQQIGGNTAVDLVLDLTADKDGATGCNL
ncbi:MAG: DUF2225 domain-containing protein [Candidatus Midichloria sp.]|nr:DUF2225 domain-containing protein [Candidatus Midichloria sp.]